MGYILSEQWDILIKMCEIKFTAMHTNYRQQRIAEQRIAEQKIYQSKSKAIKWVQQ